MSFQVDGKKFDTKAQVVEYVLTKYYNIPTVAYTFDEVVKKIEDEYSVRVSRTLVKLSQMKIYGEVDEFGKRIEATLEKNGKVWLKIVLVAIAATIVGVGLAYWAFHSDLSLLGGF
jgi:hypothetical protein